MGNLFENGGVNLSPKVGEVTVLPGVMRQC